MCWSANVSLNTYIFGLFACIFSYMNNRIKLPNLFFYQSFMSMQLIEYFVWKKQFSNKLLSQIAYILIFSQPIFGILLIENVKLKYTSLICYVIFLIILFIINPWNSIEFKMEKASNGHLSWKWLKLSIPILIIWLLFLSLNTIVKKDYLSLLFFNITAIISYVLFYKTLTWGSLWCWISNFLAFYLIGDVFYNDFCSI
jgi:hypothetical protein